MASEGAEQAVPGSTTAGCGSQNSVMAGVIFAGSGWFFCGVWEYAVDETASKSSRDRDLIKDGFMAPRIFRKDFRYYFRVEDRRVLSSFSPWIVLSERTPSIIT